MIRKHFVMVAAGLLAASVLASCGSVDVASERSRSLTSEKENNQVHERIAANKAEQEAKNAAAYDRHVSAYTERHGFPPNPGK